MRRHWFSIGILGASLAAGTGYLALSAAPMDRLTFQLSRMAAHWIDLGSGNWREAILGAGLVLVTVIIAAILFRVPAARRRTESLGLARTVMYESEMGVFTLDADEIVRTANPAMNVMFGHETYELTKLHVRHLFSEMCDKAPGWRQCSLLDADDGIFETVGVRRSGKNFPVELIVSRAPAGSLTAATIFVRDLSVYKQHQLALEYQALHDDLTGLANRALFLKRMRLALETAAASDGNATVMLLDLDRFKEVNDTLGHPIGDRLLRAIAKKLATLKPEDATLARFGGDEFCLLLPNVGSDETAIDLSERVIDALRTPFELDGISLEVGVSIGIVRYPDHGTEVIDLIQRVDVAMYAAKRAHTGFSFYDADKDRHSVQHLTLTGDLRRAVQENELTLNFQPKVDLNGGELVGVEALSRWNHREHGFIPPDEFIEHAEQTGLMIPLSEWVLNAALSQWSAWRRGGLELDIAVNLSPRMLHQIDIVGMVRKRLEKWQMPAERLVLEITENALMMDPQRAKETVRVLHDMGVRIAIDDFGTGYSSLSLLRELAAEELKIDKSFVLELTENASDRTIVESTIELAHNLGLSVVAEGIESEEAMALLRRMGCDVGQGFHIGRPMTPRDFNKWLATSAPKPATAPRQRGRAQKGTRKMPATVPLPAAAAV